MKIKKAKDISPDGEGFYIHMSVEELILFQAIMGHTAGGGTTLFTLSNEMWNDMKSTLPYFQMWGLGPVQGNVKFRDNASVLFDKAVAKYKELNDEGNFQ